MGLIAIGDIHGCANTLNKLLERLVLIKDDHLVFMGDYIDRGPFSKGVINHLIELQNEYKCTFLRGNHETLMLDYLDGGEFNIWRVNGGLATLNSYVSNNKQIEIPDIHIDFIRSTVSYFETEDFFFVHAGLKPNITIDQHKEMYDDEVYLWERSHLKAENFVWEKTVVCGHTPQPEPINRPQLLAIDTGCVYYNHNRLGKLTAVRLPEREFVTLPYVG